VTAIIALSLTLAIQRPPVKIIDLASTIVGRDRCHETTWLLTEAAGLIAVRTGAATATSQPITGLALNEPLWGMACTNDGGLWTVANSRSLVRVDSTGRVRDRVALTLPRIALFGWGDRVLFQQLPISPLTPALLAGKPQTPAEFASWTGLVQRRAASREEEISRNMVLCGIGFDLQRPCWFADSTSVVLSDGRSTSSIAIGQQVHDVAATPSAFWVLVQGRDPALNRFVGTGLLFIDRTNGGRTLLPLRTAARLVLDASESRCELLTVNGELLTVVMSR